MRPTGASSVTPPPPLATAGNGAALADVVGSPNGRRRDAPPNYAPRSPLLAKLTGVTSVAIVAAVGLMVVGVLAVLGGTYDRQVVRDQLGPQKIFFPVAGSPALLPGIK